MHFDNPKVRQRMIEHILFAVNSVVAAIPDQATTSSSEGDKVVVEMTNAFRNPIIVSVLNYTLSLDNKLRNSLRFKEGDIVEVGTEKLPLPSESLL